MNCVNCLERDYSTIMTRLKRKERGQTWTSIAVLQVLPIYMHIRLLVSCYLFLTGFGHFTYFWRKGDYSLIQYCKVSSVL